MHCNDYLKSILSDEQIIQLDKNKPIIVKGTQGPTGKTTLVSVLKKKGYTVYEGHEITEITLDSPLQKRIPDFKNTIF